MANERLISLLEQLQQELEMSQGRDLKSLLDQSKMEGGGGVGVESPMDESDENKPKGLSIQKVEVMGEPEGPEGLEALGQKEGNPDDLTDEELEELINSRS